MPVGFFYIICYLLQTTYRYLKFIQFLMKCSSLCFLNLHLINVQSVFFYFCSKDTSIVVYCRGMAWYNSKGCLIRFFKQKCMHSYIQTGTSTIFKTASNNRLVKFKTSTKKSWLRFDDSFVTYYIIYTHSTTAFFFLFLSKERVVVHGRKLVVYYFYLSLLFGGVESSNSIR